MTDVFNNDITFKGYRRRGIYYNLCILYQDEAKVITFEERAVRNYKKFIDDYSVDPSISPYGTKLYWMYVLMVGTDADN